MCDLQITAAVDQIKSQPLKLMAVEPPSHRLTNCNTKVRQSGGRPGESVFCKESKFAAVFELQKYWFQKRLIFSLRQAFIDGKSRKCDSMATTELMWTGYENYLIFAGKLTMQSSKQKKLVYLWYRRDNCVNILNLGTDVLSGNSMFTIQTSSGFWEIAIERISFQVVFCMVQVAVASLPFLLLFWMPVVSSRNSCYLY